MSTARHISFRARLLCAAGALLVSAVAAPAQQRQQLDPRLQQEARYVQALVKAGFQSYADEVVQELKRDYPGADILLKQMDVELKLMLGNWKEVMATIAKEPKDSAGYWAMQLKMADYLFAFGRYHTDPNDKDKVPGAIDIYDQLLKMEKPPEAIAADYQNALFTYAQMLVMLGNDAKACDVYKRLMTLPGISNDAKRQFTFEYAQLQVKIAEKGGGDKASRIQQARDAVKGLLWNQDLWFGRSVALLAHIFVLEGKLAEANKIVEDYEDQLIDFDQMLDEAGKQDKADYSAMSPLAECRYLQGTMLMDDGMKKLEKAAPRSKEETEAVESIAQSIDYLVEVFSGYPSFAWAPDAMSRVEQMRDKLLELGFRIEDPLTEQDRVRVAEKQFESAKVAFNQNQFKEAMETYQSALKTFPDKVPESIQGFDNLVRCAVYLSTGDLAEKNPELATYYDLYAGAVLSHLGEHFSHRPADGDGYAFGFPQKKGVTQAGNALRSLKLFLAENGKPDLADEANALFFANFPEHPSAAPALLSEAVAAYQDGEYDTAIGLFTMMVENYAGNEMSFRAQRTLAECYRKKTAALPDDEAHANERAQLRNLERETREAYLKRVAAREKPGNELVQAQYALYSMKRDDCVEKLRDASYAFFEAQRARASDEEIEAARDKLKGAVEAVEKLLDEDYKKLLDTLEDPKARAQYEATPEEKAVNDTILERCYFDQAFCRASLHEPKEKERENKKKAIESYEKLLGLATADTNTVPRVLLQLGTLYSTFYAGDVQASNDGEEAPAGDGEDAEDGKKDDPSSIPQEIKNLCDQFSKYVAKTAGGEKLNDTERQDFREKRSKLWKLEKDDRKKAFNYVADKYFTLLSDEFPKSEEARNSLFLQGKTLVDMGNASEGMKKFRQMFASKGGKFTATQLATAAQYLLDTKKPDYAVVEQGFDAALALARDDEKSLRAQIQLGKAKIKVGTKQYKEAVEALKAFIAANRSSSKYIEATEMLISACLEAAMEAPKKEERNPFFFSAIESINSLRPYKKTAAEVLDLQLRMGAVMEAQSKAEAKFKDPAAAEKFLRQASGHYQKMFLSYEYAKTDKKLRDLQELMIYRAADVLAHMKTYTDGQSVYADVKMECEIYKRDFPGGAYERKINDLLDVANAAIANKGAPAESFFAKLDALEEKDIAAANEGQREQADFEAGLLDDEDEDEDASAKKKGSSDKNGKKKKKKKGAAGKPAPAAEAAEAPAEAAEAPAEAESEAPAEEPAAESGEAEEEAEEEEEAAGDGDKEAKDSQKKPLKKKKKKASKPSEEKKPEA